MFAASLTIPNKTKNKESWKQIVKALPVETSPPFTFSLSAHWSVFIFHSFVPFG
jgi:hypothetical protein